MVGMRAGTRTQHSTPTFYWQRHNKLLSLHPLQPVAEDHDGDPIKYDRLAVSRAIPVGFRSTAAFPGFSRSTVASAASAGTGTLNLLTCWKIVIFTPGAHRLQAATSPHHCVEGMPVNASCFTARRGRQELFGADFAASASAAGVVITGAGAPGTATGTTLSLQVE